MVGQRLRLHAPNAAGWGLIPGQGNRSHLLQLKIPHAPTRTQDSQIREFFFLINCSEFISQSFLLHFHLLQEAWVVWEKLFWRNARNVEERGMCSLRTTWHSSYSSPNKKQKHTFITSAVFSRPFRLSGTNHEGNQHHPQPSGAPVIPSWPNPRAKSPPSTPTPHLEPTPAQHPPWLLLTRRIMHVLPF